MDRIIYCSDLGALKAQLKDDGYYDEESGQYIVNHTLTPIIKNGNTSLSYVRNFALDLNTYPMLEDLGTYEDIVLPENEDKLAKYKSMYDYENPIEFADENGDIHTYQRPFKIGDFA